MTREAFAEGLTRLAVATRTNLEAAAFEVYHDALDADISADEWPEFCRWAVSADRFTWFPKVVEIHDAMREFRGEPSLEGEAMLAYQRVCEPSAWTPEGGASWNYRDVRDRCGRAAAEAFLEAGAHHAFAVEYGEGKRRERFLAAYVDYVRSSPTERLLPAAAPALALPASGEPTRDEAARIMRTVVAGVPTITKAPVIVEASEARLAAIRAQAQKIVAESQPEEVKA